MYDPCSMSNMCSVYNEFSVYNMFHVRCVHKAKKVFSLPTCFCNGPSRPSSPPSSPIITTWSGHEENSCFSKWITLFILVFVNAVIKANLWPEKSFDIGRAQEKVSQNKYYYFRKFKSEKVKTFPTNLQFWQVMIESWGKKLIGYY